MTGLHSTIWNKKASAVHIVQKGKSIGLPTVTQHSRFTAGIKFQVFRIKSLGHKYTFSPELHKRS